MRITRKYSFDILKNRICFLDSFYNLPTMYQHDGDESPDFMAAMGIIAKFYSQQFFIEAIKKDDLIKSHRTIDNSSIKLIFLT